MVERIITDVKGTPVAIIEENEESVSTVVLKDGIPAFEITEVKLPGGKTKFQAKGAGWMTEHIE